MAGRMAIVTIAVIVIVWHPAHGFSQERFRKTPPPPDPLAEINLPDIQTAPLSNGLSVSVIRQNTLPLLSIKLIIMTGESSSPSHLPGLATFASRMVNKGTSTRSSAEIEEAIESIGGEFSVSLYPDYTLISFTFLEEFLDEALDLLGDMILRPTYPNVEIDNVKRTMRYDLIGKYSDPEFLAIRLLQMILFENHPYRRIWYVEEVIKNYGRKDLIDFVGRFYRPNNAGLILTGNLNLSTATRKVSHYLGTWTRTEMTAAESDPPKPPDKKRICFFDLPQAKDVTIYIGTVITLPADKNIFPYLVMNQVLGGTPNSRLFMNLRESKGYAYWAFSELEFLKNCGVFSVKIKARPEVTFASVEESLNEIKKITSERISAFEIEQAKSFLIGNFALGLETYDDLSSKLSEILAFGLKEEHWNGYYENIMIINAEKVFEVARIAPLLTPVVVIIGDVRRLTEPLAELGEVEVYDHSGRFLYSWKGEKP